MMPSRSCSSSAVESGCAPGQHWSVGGYPAGEGKPTESDQTSSAIGGASESARTRSATSASDLRPSPSAKPPSDVQTQPGSESRIEPRSPSVCSEVQTASWRSLCAVGVARVTDASAGCRSHSSPLAAARSRRSSSASASSSIPWLGCQDARDERSASHHPRADARHRQGSARPQTSAECAAVRTDG